MKKVLAFFHPPFYLELLDSNKPTFIVEIFRITTFLFTTLIITNNYMRSCPPFYRARDGDELKATWTFSSFWTFPFQLSEAWLGPGFPFGRGAIAAVDLTADWVSTPGEFLRAIDSAGNWAQSMFWSQIGGEHSCVRPSHWGLWRSRWWCSCYSGSDVFEFGDVNPLLGFGSTAVMAHWAGVYRQFGRLYLYLEDPHCSMNWITSVLGLSPRFKMADNVHLVWSGIYGWFGARTILAASKARHSEWLWSERHLWRFRSFIINVTNKVNKLGQRNFPTSIICVELNMYHV